nr:hypothetical protein [Tanacetum cinerariifolium]
MLVTMGEGSGTPTEPHHTPSPKAQQTSPTATSSPSLPPVTTATIPTVIPNDTPQLRQYTRRARIAQSSAPPPIADEPASPIGDESQGDACPTDSCLEAEQDRENITKTSTLPSDSTPRVTSLAPDEGNMKHKLTELMNLCTRLQRQQDEMASKITGQDLEISALKAMIKHLEDRDGGDDDPSGEDATIKGRKLETGEEASIEMKVATVSIPPAGEILTISIPTGSGVVLTASPIFTTATVATPFSRRKVGGRIARDAQRMNEQIDRDAEIARIHVEEELQMLIDSLNRNNKTIAKYLQEYEQFAADLSIEERIELINDLVKYHDNYAKVLKYQSQQRKPLSKKQQREFYMSVLRSHAGWKTKHFKGTSLEEIREKFDPVWKQIQDFVLMGSKEEGERFKIKGISLEHDSAKKVKILKEVSKEDLKAMMQLVPVEEVYVEALQHFDREDLNHLWAATSNKEKELWVELKRLYEPDVEDQLWTQTQALMHDPVEWRLYDTYGVHHVLSRDQEIFMLVEKEYPLRKGLAIAMIINKLQVENYSQMANDLVQKIYKIANSPSQRSD